MSTYEQLSVEIAGSKLRLVMVRPQAPKFNDLVITFHGRYPTDKRRAKELQAWGQDFLLGCGFSVAGFVCEGNSWFQELLSPQAIEHSIKVLDEMFPREQYRRISYGTSMGGYAAVKFSKALGVSKVLALSPATEIKSHPLWMNDLEHEINPVTAEDLQGNPRLLLAYDPTMLGSDVYAQDVAYVESILKAHPDKARVQLLKLPYFNHPVTVPLAVARHLKPLFLKFVESDETFAFPVDTRGLRKSDRYVFRKLKVLVGKERYTLAARFAFLARQTVEENQRLLRLTRRALKKSGMFPDYLEQVEARLVD